MRAGLALAVTTFAGLVACAGGGEPEPIREVMAAAAAAPPGSEPAAEHHHDHAMATEAGELPGTSIYHLGAEWYDQEGARRALDSLAGRVQVVAMVYTNCAYACPRIITEMKRLERAFSEKAADRLGFVLFSIDPQRDDPARLQAFARDTRLDPERWTLLSAADEDGVLEIAAALGIRYQRESPTDFVHSNVLVVLDEFGEPRYRQVGVGERDERTAAELERLLAGGSSIAR
jgi:protein SCO1/2